MDFCQTEKNSKKIYNEKLQSDDGRWREILEQYVWTQWSVIGDFNEGYVETIYNINICAATMKTTANCRWSIYIEKHIVATHTELP